MEKTYLEERQEFMAYRRQLQANNKPSYEQDYNVDTVFEEYKKMNCHELGLKGASVDELPKGVRLELIHEALDEAKRGVYSYRTNNLEDFMSEHEAAKFIERCRYDLNFGLAYLVGIHIEAQVDMLSRRRDVVVPFTYQRERLGLPVPTEEEYYRKLDQLRNE